MRDYQSYNYVNINRAERLGLDQYRPDVGYNSIRIVCPSHEGSIGLTVWKHQMDDRVVLCPEKMYGLACPQCRYDKPTERFLLYVIDTSSDATISEGVKWFDCCISIYRAICSLSIDKETGLKVDPTDPTSGREFTFERRDMDEFVEYYDFSYDRSMLVLSYWNVSELPDMRELLI